MCDEQNSTSEWILCVTHLVTPKIHENQFSLDHNL